MYEEIFRIEQILQWHRDVASIGFILVWHGDS